MYVVLVHVRVKEDKVDDFVKATLENAAASVKELGNRRFDVLQSVEDPCKFILYEAWGSIEDAAAHKDTTHYQKWRDTVADWMAEPRRGVEYRSLFP